jgi:hypothetical protein
VQDLVEEEVGTVVWPHAVAQDDVGHRISPDPRAVVTDRSVCSTIDLPDRIADAVDQVWIVPEMSPIVEMPELMPDAMRLGEHREEEVVVRLLQEPR